MPTFKEFAAAASAELEQEAEKIEAQITELEHQKALMRLAQHGLTQTGDIELRVKPFPHLISIKVTFEQFIVAARIGATVSDPAKVLEGQRKLEQLRPTTDIFTRIGWYKRLIQIPKTIPIPEPEKQLAEGVTATQIFDNGSAVVDFLGKQVILSSLDFPLLSALSVQPNEFIPFMNLSAELGDISAARLHMRVTRLREKVEPEPNKPRFIRARRGIPGGYGLFLPQQNQPE